jgi:hypothetical protein
MHTLIMVDTCYIIFTQTSTNPLSPMLEDLEVFFSLTLQVQCCMYVIELKREMDLLYNSIQGLNFQLAAVLLSIGIYAYIENGNSH